MLSGRWSLKGAFTGFSSVGCCLAAPVSLADCVWEVWTGVYSVFSFVYNEAGPLCSSVREIPDSVDPSLSNSLGEGNIDDLGETTTEGGDEEGGRGGSGDFCRDDRSKCKSLSGASFDEDPWLGWYCSSAIALTGRSSFTLLPASTAFISSLSNFSSSSNWLYTENSTCFVSGTMTSSTKWSLLGTVGSWYAADTALLLPDVFELDIEGTEPSSSSWSLSAKSLNVSCWEGVVLVSGVTRDSTITSSFLIGTIVVVAFGREVFASNAASFKELTANTGCSLSTTFILLSSTGLNCGTITSWTPCDSAFSDFTDSPCDDVCTFSNCGGLMVKSPEYWGASTSNLISFPSTIEPGLTFDSSFSGLTCTFAFSVLPGFSLSSTAGLHEEGVKASKSTFSSLISVNGLGVPVFSDLTLGLISTTSSPNSDFVSSPGKWLTEVVCTSTVTPASCFTTVTGSSSVSCFSGLTCTSSLTGLKGNSGRCLFTKEEFTTFTSSFTEITGLIFVSGLTATTFGSGFATVVSGSSLATSKDG